MKTAWTVGASECAAEEQGDDEKGQECMQTYGVSRRDRGPHSSCIQPTTYCDESPKHESSHGMLDRVVFDNKLADLVMRS